MTLPLVDLHVIAVLLMACYVARVAWRRAHHE